MATTMPSHEHPAFVVSQLVSPCLVPAPQHDGESMFALVPCTRLQYSRRPLLRQSTQPSLPGYSASHHGNSPLSFASFKEPPHPI
jgi:hypothetical protein